MATDVDLFGIKQRIVDILDSNSTLFDATGANDKVRKIDAGAPRMSRLRNETTLPHIWVTNEDAIDVIRQNNSVGGNAPKVLEHQINFKIILMAQEKDGFKTEEVLDDFVKLINQSITENYELNDPATGLSPLADSCYPSRVVELGRVFTGLSLSGRVISLKCVVTTG